MDRIGLDEPRGSRNEEAVGDIRREAVARWPEQVGHGRRARPSRCKYFVPFAKTYLITHLSQLVAKLLTEKLLPHLFLRRYVTLRGRADDEANFFIGPSKSSKIRTLFPPSLFHPFRSVSSTFPRVSAYSPQPRDKGGLPATCRNTPAATSRDRTSEELQWGMPIGTVLGCAQSTEGQQYYQDMQYAQSTNLIYGIRRRYVIVIVSGCR